MVTRTSPAVFGRLSSQRHSATRSEAAARWRPKNIEFATLMLLLAPLVAHIESACEMTYMHPHYEPVTVDGHETHAGLHRYLERGAVPQERCELVVLFVPGMRASYQQVRSIASVAIGMRRAAVHFYALDLGAAFSALDGDLLAAHALATRRALSTLRVAYADGGPSGGLGGDRVARARRSAAVPGAKPALAVLAHSMGGIAALEALQPEHADSGGGGAAGLVLLAAPVQRPPFDGASGSLRRAYTRLRERWAAAPPLAAARWQAPAVASICGGGADWQVAPALTALAGAVHPSLHVLPPERGGHACSGALAEVLVDADHQASRRDAAMPRAMR